MEDFSQEPLVGDTLDVDGDVGMSGRPLKAPNRVLNVDGRSMESLFDLGLVSSPKKDGNRGLCINGVLYTSSMKYPLNRRLHEWMMPLIEYSTKHSFMFDYELYDPEASHHGALSGTINSYANPLPESMGCYLFDACPTDEWVRECADLPYSERIHMYHSVAEKMPNRFITLTQRTVESVDEIQSLFQQDLANGDEGSMIRTTHIDERGGSLVGGWYKHGRATPNQCIIWKLKNYVTLDGIIVGVEQRRKLMEGVDRTFNPRTGLAENRYGQDCYGLDDAVGSFVVKYQDDDGNVSSSKIGFGVGFPIEDRRRMWQEYTDVPESLLGRWVEFTHMPHGALSGGQLRIGRLIRFRDDLEKASL